MPWMSEPPAGVFTCVLHSSVSQIRYSPASWMWALLSMSNVMLWGLRQHPVLAVQSQWPDVLWSGAHCLLGSSSEVGAAPLRER